MKNLLLSAAILTAGNAMAQASYELDIPSLEDQAKQAEELQFQDVLKTFQTAPDFAGTFSQLSFRGQNYVVDRRGEQATKPVGQEPSGAARIAKFVNSLSAEARGSVHISVSYTFNADGTIKSENWQLDFQGSWQSQAGMNDALGKTHK